MTSPRFLRSFRCLAALAIFCVPSLGAAVPVVVTPAANPYITPAMEQTVEATLSQMTLEEKIKLCNGDIEKKTPNFRGAAAVERLGIGPAIFYNGPRGYQAGTSSFFPAGIALGSSFDPDLARREAGVIAAESRAGLTDFFEAPGINIIRDPLSGRNFEYYTEDPYLNGRLAAEYVRGAQDEGVTACAKHFICNNQETNRNEVNEVVGERALREIYLPGFQAAINAGVLSIMTGANRVNGDYASSSASTLAILIHDFGFKGFIVTDWTGVRETVKAANAGCDLSMPGSPTGKFSEANLLAAVKSGAVSEETITDKARRLLRAYYFTGRMRGAPPTKKGEKPDGAHTAVALEAAQKGMVLLKNAGGCLPLDAQSLRTVAVLGPNADKHFSGGGSSAVLRMVHEVTAVDGLRQRLGATRVNYVPFSAAGFYQVLDQRFVKTEAGQTRESGFLATYSGFKPNTTEKTSYQEQVDGIDFNWEMASPDRQKLDSGNFTCRWQGILTPPDNGLYGFRLSGRERGELLVDGKLVIEIEPAAREREGVVDLKAGQPVSIEVRYHKTGGQGKDAGVRLEWTRPVSNGPGGDTGMEPSLAAARAADAAIVCIGQDHSLDIEGSDRKGMDLPQYQLALARAVAKVNPHTVVVLYTGSPVSMGELLDDVPAILLPWYPGMENGRAVAGALFGDFDPAGKLPISWPRHEQDSPATASRQQPSKHDTVLHSEGIFVGYRWYDEKKIEPQFPFGYGLSYSTFAMRLKAAPTDWQIGQPLSVQVEVQNTGQRAGAEVVQLYVHQGSSLVPRPPEELKAFQRVELQAGESKVVTLALDDNSFAYWHPDQHRWVIDPGAFELRVGASSRDIKLVQAITVKE